MTVPDVEPAPAASLYYPNVAAWVQDYLTRVYRRPLSSDSVTWCPEWWKHPEAVVRLEALWRAWEHLRLDAALGISVWLRDHADHHMSVLLDTRGPFHGCRPERHTAHELEPLPAQPPPPELFGLELLPADDADGTS